MPDLGSYGVIINLVLVLIVSVIFMVAGNALGKSLRKFWQASSKDEAKKAKKLAEKSDTE